MDETQVCVSAASINKQQGIEQGQVSWKNSQRLGSTERYEQS